MIPNNDDIPQATQDLAVPDDATMIEGVDDYFVFHVRPRPEAAVVSGDVVGDEAARPAVC